MIIHIYIYIFRFYKTKNLKNSLILLKKTIILPKIQYDFNLLLTNAEKMVYLI